MNTKINRNNAEMVIADLLSGYEVKKGSGGNYIEMTENEYDEIVEGILSACIKSFRPYVEKYTNKYSIAWLGFGGRISTYTKDYAFVKFI